MVMPALAAAVPMAAATALLGRLRLGCSTTAATAAAAKGRGLAARHAAEAAEAAPETGIGGCLGEGLRCRCSLHCLRKNHSACSN